MYYAHVDDKRRREIRKYIENNLVLRKDFIYFVNELKRHEHVNRLRGRYQQNEHLVEAREVD